MGGDSAEVISQAQNRSDSGLSEMALNFLYGILAGKTTISWHYSAVTIILIRQFFPLYIIGSLNSIEPYKTVFYIQTAMCALGGQFLGYSPTG